VEASGLRLPTRFAVDATTLTGLSLTLAKPDRGPPPFPVEFGSHHDSILLRLTM
jgi:hypothetical protein